MVGSSVDHLVSLTIFIAAMVIFIGLFNQTLQTAVLYQNHRGLATKTSDLLDNMLLSPGSSLLHGSHWGEGDDPPVSFGLQDPDLSQYNLSPFSIMRLNSLQGNPVYYPFTGQTYSNITLGFGQSLMVPYSSVVNYSLASKLMGINGSYGFTLTLTPIVKVEISEDPSDPLSLRVSVKGSGSPLINAEVNFCFITVDGSGGEGQYPSYTVDYSTTFTNDVGLTYFSLTEMRESYSLIAYAHLSNLVGVAYYTHRNSPGSYIIPFLSNFETGKVTLAHSHDVIGGDNPEDLADVKYNATAVFLGKDFSLHRMELSGTTVGQLNSGGGQSNQNVTINSHSLGILVVTYRKSAQETGVVVMPWGLCSLGFPVTFGGNPSGQEWVATDLRQVLINGFAYQAKLALWSFEGVQV